MTYLVIFDFTVCVYSSEKIQMKGIRSRLTNEESNARIRSVADYKKSQLADFVVLASLSFSNVVTLSFMHPQHKHFVILFPCPKEKQTDEPVDDASSIKEKVVKDSDENKQTASENDTIAETAKSPTEEDSGGQLFQHGWI